MDNTEEKQDLLDESYNLIYEIDQAIQELFHPIDKQFILPKVNKLYDKLISFSEAPHFEDDAKENADELSSNIFLATIYLYFAYTILDEIYGGLAYKTKALFNRITLFISKIPAKTDLILILEELIKYRVSRCLQFRSYYEMLNYKIFFILAKYYTLANDNQQIYKSINNAILQNKDLEQWMNVLEILVFLHSAQISNSEEKRERPEPNLVKLYCRESAVLSIVKKNIDYKEPFPSGLRRYFGDNTEYSDFKTLLYTDDATLDKYPCISYLLYKSISKMTYHKCKSFFTEKANPPKPFIANETEAIYNGKELEKYSFIIFKGEWAQNRIQKMMFFAIAEYVDKSAVNEALEKREWGQPETQKNILNNVLSSNRIPKIENSFDFSRFKDDAFSSTETALNLLYNIACFNETGRASDIIQQINFIDEQRSRLFIYQDIKPTNRILKDDEPKSNQKDPKYFDKFCPQSRRNLEKEIETMKKIDCGFPLPMQVQLFPTYNKEVFARRQNCKLFLETDTACNLHQEDFYRNRYKNMLQTRYIYPARNMATHYSRYTPTESLLEERNFTDLSNFLFDAKSRLQKEQELRKLKQDLIQHKLNIPGHSWPSLKYSFDNHSDLYCLIKDIINQEEYTGKLNNPQLNELASKLCSEIREDNLYYTLSEIRNDYPVNNDTAKELDFYISYFKRHAIVVPKEDSSKLIGLFRTAEEFFVQNKDTFVKAVCQAFDKKDYEKAERAENFLGQYLFNIKNLDDNTRKAFRKIGLAIHDQKSQFSQEEKSVFDIVIENVFDHAKKHVLAKKIESEIKADDAKAVYGSINNIWYTHSYFLSTTDLSLAEIMGQIREYFPLYEIKIIKQSASKIKVILDDLKDNNKGKDKELDIFDPCDLQKLIELRKFEEFNARINQMMQVIDKYILFYYAKDHDLNFESIFHNENEKEEHLKEYYKGLTAYLKELLKNKAIDELKTAFKRIEYFELPNIDLDQPHAKYYNDYLKFIESLNAKCKDLDNIEILQMAKNIRNIIFAKKEEAKQEYDKDSINVFKDDEIHDSFLIKRTLQQLLNTIKCCTESLEVRKVLVQNKKTFLDKEGKLGLNKDEKLSDDIHYSEEFKNNLRQFLNTMFGVSNICAASPKDDYDSINFSDIQETDINFFDQYNKQILLYLIRVTVELAHYKKIEI